jgi:putative transposase
MWIPKCRKRRLYGGVVKYLGSIFHELAKERESRIVEGHVPMLIKIPPKYSVTQVVGYIKGKSAIGIARRFVVRQRNFTGQNFWGRGSTVGWDEAQIRKYILEQEAEDKRLDQFDLFKDK